MSDDLQRRFLDLHMPHQRHLMGYLMSAVRDFHDAEDLLQDVTLALWEQFPRYDPARPYLPWALGVARNRVARFFRDRDKDHVSLPLDVIENIVSAMAENEEGMERERAALQRCVERLAPPHRELIRQRYESGLSLNDLAKSTGKNAGAVNMLLFRIRRQLLECANRMLSKEVQ